MIAFLFSPFGVGLLACSAVGLVVVANDIHQLLKGRNND
jgi:hypothetical protein